MELTSHYDRKKKIISVCLIGDITIDYIKYSVDRALELSAKHKCNLLLFDIRKCKENQSLIEAFGLMQNTTASLGFSFEHKVAVVYDPENYSEERADFVENVVVNRPNPHFKFFLSLNVAEKWLKHFETPTA